MASLLGNTAHTVQHNRNSVEKYRQESHSTVITDRMLMYLQEKLYIVQCKMFKHSMYLQGM
uniref:Uncharacterized protein n=1 Tax=Anguilla anguilla TaxID=7936 RepID=A0A0E9U037_ANGAN